MNLTIDIGNTFVKYAVFDNDQIIYNEKSSDSEREIILNITQRYLIQSCIISSVRKKDSLIKLKSYLPLNINVSQLSHKTKIPCVIKYNSPKTLGADRIANIVGANSLYPNKDILIIDTGSCITVDLIDSNGLYLGGRISPGLEMRYKSLHCFTSRLPELKIQNNFLYLGKDTHSSIVSGVQAGIVAEIDTIISYYKKENDDLFVIVTGGDLFFFENALKSTIFADQDLVLKGLNEILQYNE